MVGIGPEYWPNYWDDPAFISAAPDEKPRVFQQLLEEYAGYHKKTLEEEVAFLRENPRYRKYLPDFPWMEELYGTPVG